MGVELHPGFQSMKKAFDLDPGQDAAWEELFSGARKASESDEHATAIELVDRAWQMIPEPRIECSVAYITLMRRIAVRYRAAEWQQGAVIARNAADTTPFPNQIPAFNVKEGIGLLEAGKRDEAWSAFDRAWNAGRDFGFKGEDPKYLVFYKAGA